MDILKTGLYKNKKIRTDGWCKNETYIPHFRNDGTIFMVDSYWSGSGSDEKYEVTKDNINDWELIMDYEKVKRTYFDDYILYDEEDRFSVADDSGGWSYRKYYILKDKQKSKEKVMRFYKNELKSAKENVKYYENKIKELSEAKKG